MHETAKKLKRRGFLLLEGVLLLAVLSALSVGTTAIFSGQFNTMNAGKQASQAQQYASVEGTYVRIKGYPNVDDLTHDWKDMSDLVGTEDGANWESKVEVARTAKTDDGNEMKVIKLSVRKKGDIVSRFSEEIPLVSGMEVYTKDEIDTMFDTVDSEINNLNSDLDAFKNQTASNFTDIINNINTINGNLDTLRQMIEAEKATREAAINAEHNAWMAALQNEQAARTARDAELTSQISSLQDSLSKLQSALNTEISQRKAEDSKLEAADNNLQQQINKEVADRKSAITTLQNDVNSKYEELKNLYNNLKGRLDGSEFVKSKDAANNIALKYEQKDGESTKSLHGYVDGVEVPLASQNKASSSNIGIPDYSKVNSLIFAIKKYSGNIYEDSNLYPNPIFLADKSNSSFIIPEDGWILYIRPDHRVKGHDSEWEIYSYYYYVNNNRIYDAPTPVKKGDSITSLDTRNNRLGGYVIYAPNQKNK